MSKAIWRDFPSKDRVLQVFEEISSRGGQASACRERLHDLVDLVCVVRVAERAHACWVIAGHIDTARDFACMSRAHVVKPRENLSLQH